MNYPIDHLVLVYRPRATSADAPVGTPGDIVEAHGISGPIREVDPHTRQATEAAQCFLCESAGQLRPVRRDSWTDYSETQKAREVKRAPLTALEAYQRKHGIYSSKARMR